MAETQPAKATEPDLHTKLEEARRALEGEEHAAKREQNEQRQTIKAERETLEQRLAAIVKEKEALELSWVDLDSKRKIIREILTPILAEEKQTEEEEAALEAEEAKIGVESEKHGVEEKRWAVQAKRKEVEQQKWAEEEKLIALDKSVEENTQKYRLLLDEEEKGNARLEQLKAQEI